MAYIKTTNFAIKDTYLTGNPAKVVRGVEIDVEFDNVATASSINVVGSTTSTDNYVPQWDGITGKLLKNGKPVQTSTSDTTAGALMAVGAFGLGGGVVFNSGRDLNNITATGFSTETSAINGPTAGTQNLIHFQNSAGGGRSFQLSQGVNTPDFYLHHQTAGTWSIWDKIITDATSYGHNQTAVDVTGSRAISTTYTNTTGKPITCSVVCSPASANGTVQVATINGATTYYGAYSPAPNGVITIIFMVPVGATYSCAINNGTAPLVTWKELR